MPGLPENAGFPIELPVSPGTAGFPKNDRVSQEVRDWGVVVHVVLPRERMMLRMTMAMISMMIDAHDNHDDDVDDGGDVIAVVVVVC